MKFAYVYLEEILIGKLEYDGLFINFVYEPSWKEKGFSISHSLPFDSSFSSKQAHQYFANLLPEGNLRDMVCKKLSISPDNDWELLLRLGKESAGALIIVQEPKSSKTPSEYEKLTEEDIDRFSKSTSVMPHIISNEATRLSLAGAQDKMAVYFDGKDYWLPLNGSPTNVIFKFDNQGYGQITANEIFVTHLAQALGLPTSKCRLYTKSSTPIAIFDRYDRLKKKGSMTRIHQEDLCQVLGRSQKNKYEKEGGANFAEALDIISKISSNPTKDRQTLIQWQIFNILCGNSDGHSKNVSFFRKKGEVLLTPLYDLVCTRVFNTLDRNLAMSYGGTFDPNILDITRIEKWSEEIGVTRAYLTTEIFTLIEKIHQTLHTTENDFTKEYGKQGLVEQIQLFISKQIKRVERALKTE